MNQNAFEKIKLLIILCLLVFRATGFAKSQPSADGLVPKQFTERKMPNTWAQLKSGKALIYFGEKQFQTTDVTGTYLYKAEGRKNKTKVMQTGAGEIKVSFEGIYQYKIPGGYLNTRTGDLAAQTIKFEKGTAVLTTDDATDCRITLTFTNGVLKVVQNANDCGFAIGVDASGIYRRTSAAEPIFPSDSGIPPDAILEDIAGKASNSSSKRVRFPKGADKVMIAGDIADGGSLFYIIGARRGQTINVQLIDEDDAKNKVVVSVAGKNGAGLKVEDNDGKFLTGRTLANGDFIITVNAAGTQHANFKISVSIY